MQCTHKVTKPKLVSVATDSRLGHEQHFEIKECCVKCGVIAEKGVTSGVESSQQIRDTERGLHDLQNLCRGENASGSVVQAGVHSAVHEPEGHGHSKEDGRGTSQCPFEKWMRDFYED